MKMFEEFTRFAPNRVFIAILLGAVAGMSYALLLPLLLSALSKGGELASADEWVATLMSVRVREPGLAVMFIVVVLFSFFGRILSEVLLVRLSVEYQSKLRKDIYKRIAHTFVADYERLGPAAINASIAGDIGNIISAIRVIPGLFSSAVTLAAMSLFLLYLNADVFWFVALAVVSGVLAIQAPFYIARQHFKKSRLHLDVLFEQIRGLLYGHKELKLSAAKRKDYVDGALVECEENYLRAQKDSDTARVAGGVLGDNLPMLAAGFLVFVFVNYHAESAADLLGSIMVLMYITSPVANFVYSIPIVSIGGISLKKVNSIYDALPEEVVSCPKLPAHNWNVMHLKSMCYRHRADEGESGFEIGPLDISICTGEITFIVGGNGSGKSTLGKLITMHYVGSHGSIRFDGQELNTDCIESYRQQVAAIFSDYYLFDRLLGDISDSSIIEEYLKMLELDRKVSIRDGRFSTTSLSDGQRRRLALLVSFLEDKRLYLFDEWAADQDPEFKRFFYVTLLPRLKQQGKAVVVITHDDRYFSCADKVVFMENGRIVDVVAQTN